MAESEANRVADGAPPRDLSAYTRWRAEAKVENLEAMDFYERYLVGQTAGLGSGLSLDAVRAALEIDEVPRADWPERSRRLLLLHREVVACVSKGKG